MMSEPQAFGRKAEALAEQYLRGQGYRILGKNLRLAGGEIDLIAEWEETLVFVEVKARRTTKFGGARHAIDGSKVHRLIRLAAQYLAKHDSHHRPCRFDVILCQEGGEGAMDVEHIENAFEIRGSESPW